MIHATWPGLTPGIHGCEESVRNGLITGEMQMHPGRKPYAWLGIHESFVSLCDLESEIGEERPVNKSGGGSGETLLRNLDYAMIENLHKRELRFALAFVTQ